MPRLTIDGKEIEVAPGTNLIEAAHQAGIEVPHYCYHPGLSIAGQCRLCMVDIEKVPRPQIGCNTAAADGMVVHTQTERVLETRKSIMEFHLINHPLDCPVCDQAGECWLQIYYMKHGLYDPRMVDEKVHKPKAVPLGPHVILDAERCILCSRCVRFCDEVTRTGELGIFNRGDHSEIGLFPGTALENKYSGNVIDICPVGALTDRDFRFQVRVWYLDTTRSVCPGCARGCNIEIHTNRHRTHHNRGRRVARIKPRFNADVNRWWICDAGRYGFRWIDDDSRLTTPLVRQGERQVETTWDDAIQTLAGALRRCRPEEVGILASPQMSNEDLFMLGRLAEQLARESGVVFDPAMLFDVQVKRIHEYKRQLLNLLHVVHRYQAMLANPEGPEGRGWTPRTVILAGKAASAYAAAKQIVRLAHDIGRVINADPRLEGRLKLVFLPNYGVSLAEAIIPAADLSEQISTAGTEASGTGNMKFAMNGALTIGTWDGATIEMAQHIGEADVFVFGLRADAVARLKATGYDPRWVAAQQPALMAVLDAIGNGAFSPGEPSRYRALVDGLLNRDPYLLLADFADYVATQARVDALYRDPVAWNAAVLRNLAGMGFFSADRTVAEYATHIWSPPPAMPPRADPQRNA